MKAAFFDNLILKLALYCHQKKLNLEIKNDRGLYNNIIEQSRNKEKMSRSILNFLKAHKVRGTVI